VQSILDFAFQAWRATPQMRIEDAYKWLFHATLGGEHAIKDDAGPRRWMENEWPSVGEPFPGEVEIVELSPDGLILRVNMRPFKARGGDPESLLKVFVDSARTFKADSSVFVQVWEQFGSLLQKEAWQGLTHAEWIRLDGVVRAADFPAIGHSDDYEQAYEPHYRVVLRSLWP